LYAVFWLGSAYREKKMYREALEQFELACRLTQDHPAMLWAYGHTLAVAGRREEAQAVLAKLLTIKQTQLVPALYVAGMYAGLGDKEQSFHWLDQAADEHDDRIIYLNVDPLADPLRGDARFNALMKGAGLP
jgi:tetratricopeptide (TPR) repeat protein